MRRDHSSSRTRDIDGVTRARVSDPAHNQPGARAHITRARWTTTQPAALSRCTAIFFLRCRRARRTVAVLSVRRAIAALCRAAQRSNPPMDSPFTCNHDICLKLDRPADVMVTHQSSLAILQPSGGLLSDFDIAHNGAVLYVTAHARLYVTAYAHLYVTTYAQLCTPTLT